MNTTARVEREAERRVERQRVSFEALARRFHAGVFNYLCWISRDAGLAEDLTQEAFMQIWQHPPEVLGDRAVHMHYLGPEGELLHASVLDCQAGFWWVYARDKSALYEADLEPLGGKACEIIDRLAEMIRASQLTEAMRAYFPDAQESLEMATRDGREVALVTVSYTTDAGGVPVHVREVFEVDPETDHLLSTGKFARAGEGAEELVGAVERVEYDVPLPDAAAAAGIPERTATVQATAGIEETSSTFGLVMKVDGVEFGRMDVLRAE